MFFVEYCNGENEETMEGSLQIQGGFVPHVGERVLVTSAFDGETNECLNQKVTDSNYQTVVKGVVVRVEHECGLKGIRLDRHRLESAYYHAVRVFVRPD